MCVTIRMMISLALRDCISLFWAVLFPIVLVAILGHVFPSAAYQRQLLVGGAAMSAVFFAMTGTAFEVMKQRRQGVYKLLRATPFSTAAFVLSLTLARTMITVMSAGIVLVAGTLIFGLSLPLTAVALMVPALIAAILCFSFLGLTMGNLVSQESQVAMLNNLITLPMVFASETFYSTSGAPDWLQTISGYLPLSHLLRALQAALTPDISQGLIGALLLSCFALAALGLAVLTFRWDPDAPLFRLPGRGLTSSQATVSR